MGEIDLLENLIKLSPLPRRLTLLEAVEMGRVELPQSLFLAWLLGSQGPVRDYWLLRALFESALPGRTWPGIPKSVLPEVANATERPDIVVAWAKFTLVIEYKIDAREGKDQVKRYLKTFKINDPLSGAVIFLTPDGSNPRSMPRDDRVIPMSFDRLIDCIDNAISGRNEITAEERVFVGEYRDCLNRVRYRSISKMDVQISESTMLLFKYSEHLETLQATAKDEAAVFLRALVARISSELRSLFGEDTFHISQWGPYATWLFRKDDWISGDYGFGVAFSAEAKLAEKMMQDYQHYVYVGFQPLTNNAVLAPAESTLLELRGIVVREMGPGDRGNDLFTAWMRQVPIDDHEKWSDWADRVVGEIQVLASKVAVALHDFARIQRSGKQSIK